MTDIELAKRKGQELIKAAAQGDGNSLLELIAEGADVNAQNEHGYTALIYVANRGDVETLKALLDAGADVNRKNKFGMTALMRAAFSDKSANLELLIAAGADLDARDSHGESALMWAQRTGRKENVEILQRAGAAEYDEADFNRKALVNDPSAPLSKAKKKDSIINRLLRAFGIE
jgi:uncharacterized protein